MNKDTEKRALKALERQEKQYKRQYDWTKNNRDRLVIILPKGTRDRITALGFSSMSAYAADLILTDLERREAAARLSQAVQDLPEELPEDPPFM